MDNKQITEYALKQTPSRLPNPINHLLYRPVANPVHPEVVVNLIIEKPSEESSFSYAIKTNKLLY